MIADCKSIPRLLWVVVAALAASSTRAQDPKAVDKPASIACNAAYSEPCARTNSEYLARTVAKKLAEATDVSAFLEEINDGLRNIDQGFYPFVVNRNTSECVAHGAFRRFAGKNLEAIFNDTRIAYSSNATALHERFLAANNSWVRYLWSDGAGAAATDGSSPSDYTVHSKLAFVINVNDVYYLGVGYENQPLPVDLPCSASFDSLCSLINVRSLVGKAQFRLNQAESLEAFEEAVFDISFSPEFKEEDFYLFMYDENGFQKAHGINLVGTPLADVYVENGIGNHSEGLALHNRFLVAVKENDSAFVRYQWKGKLEKDVYWKIAYLARVGFASNRNYYIGAGYNFKVDAFTRAPLEEQCSAQYNLPCSFAIAHQLSSHALSHAISSLLPIEDMFASITHDLEFKTGGHIDDRFYLFVYEVESAKCVAHGANSSYVGMNLAGVLNELGIKSNATQLHEQFTTAAEQGGGWVLYPWRSSIEKISYIFQINLDGKGYYGGVGFIHDRYPIREHAEKGKTKDRKTSVLCTKRFKLDCSEVNTQGRPIIEEIH
jgi:hypothetical protein